MTLTTEKYTEGLCGDGAAILCDGVPMSVSEILATLNAVVSREAQPVEYGDAYQGAREDLSIWKRRALEAEDKMRHLEKINDHLVKEAQGEHRMGEPILTAPPAPAVPEAITAANAPEVFEIAAEVERLGLRGVYGAYAVGWNACRAAMLAQPVSSGYTLPDGYKLMPLEMTDEIGEAIAMEARCCGGIALCIYEAALAAAPEGGNDHDTRR
ncbi:hypothetical protein ACUNGU_08595 [Serratia sp. IR-2025]